MLVDQRGLFSDRLKTDSSVLHNHLEVVAVLAVLLLKSGLHLFNLLPHFVEAEVVHSFVILSTSVDVLVVQAP